MAHLALVKDGIVQHILVIDNAMITDKSGKEDPSLLSGLIPPGQWVQCSYNGKIRNCYPGIGFRYDAELDIFTPPLPDEKVDYDGSLNYFLEITKKWEEKIAEEKRAKLQIQQKADDAPLAAESLTDQPISE